MNAKIKVEPQSTYGFFSAVICLEECQYEKTCANHTSAGDFRTEGGVTPKLSLSGGKIYCSTKNCPRKSDIYWQKVPVEEGVPQQSDCNCVRWIDLCPPTENHLTSHQLPLL